MLFLLAIVTNAPIDDYDTDVATEENNYSSQPISKLHDTKGNCICMSLYI